MNRRGFLKGAAGVVAGAAAVAAVATPVQADNLTHNGYRVKWRDFVSPPNQNVVVGMWLAKHGTRDLQWVSTTLGQCYPSRDWEVVDMSRADDSWPLLTVFSTDAERAPVKARALEKLIAVL